VASLSGNATERGLAEISSGTQLFACRLQDQYGMVPKEEVLSSFGCHLESRRSWQILPSSQVIVRRSGGLHVHRAARSTRVGSQ
jgi:hypothetical protein